MYVSGSGDKKCILKQSSSTKRRPSERTTNYETMTRDQSNFFRSIELLELKKKTIKDMVGYIDRNRKNRQPFIILDPTSYLKHG